MKTKNIIAAVTLVLITVLSNVTIAQEEKINNNEFADYAAGISLSPFGGSVGFTHNWNPKTSFQAALGGFSGTAPISPEINGTSYDKRTDDVETVTASVNEVQVDLDDMYSVYLALNITDNSYIKAGITSVDVITNETMGTGASYGNTSLDGTLVGVGINHDLSNGFFVRAEGVYIAFDGVSLTSGDNTINLKSLDGVNGTVSIGKSF